MCTGSFRLCLYMSLKCVFLSSNKNWKHFGMSTLLVVYAHSIPFDVFVKILYAKAPATESKSES